MNIMLIQNPRVDRQNSMLRFGQMLTTIVSHTWTPPVVLSRTYGIDHGGLFKWLGYIDKFLIGSFLLIAHTAFRRQCIHIADHSNGIYALLVPKSRLSITCHDTIAIRAALDGKTKFWGRLFQRANLAGLHRARRIVCVSAATARCLRDLGIPDERLVVIENALNRQFRQMNTEEATRILAGAGAPQGDFILHVGGNQWYKNRQGAVAAYTAWRARHPEHPAKLVLIGKYPNDELAAAIKKSSVSRDIFTIVEAPDAVVEAAYNSALIMLFPSIEEGFGWPVVEAQACGCPVVTSNREPMTDVGGAGAVYANPTDPEALANAMDQALSTRAMLIAEGLKNVERFGLPSMQAKYRALFEEMNDLRSTPVNKTVSN